MQPAGKEIKDEAAASGVKDAIQEVVGDVHSSAAGLQSNIHCARSISKKGHYVLAIWFYIIIFFIMIVV